MHFVLFCFSYRLEPAQHVIYMFVRTKAKIYVTIIRMSDYTIYFFTNVLIVILVKA